MFTHWASPTGHAILSDMQWASLLFLSLSSPPFDCLTPLMQHSLLRGRWNCSLHIMTEQRIAFNYTKGDSYHHFQGLCCWACHCVVVFARLQNFPSPSTWVCACLREPMCKSPQHSKVNLVCSAFRWADIWTLTACQRHVQVCRRNRPPSDVLLGDNNLWEDDVTQKGGGRRDKATRADRNNIQTQPVQHSGVDCVTYQLVVKLVRLASRLFLKARQEWCSKSVMTATHPHEHESFIYGHINQAVGWDKQ